MSAGFVLRSARVSVSCLCLPFVASFVVSLFAFILNACGGVLFCNALFFVGSLVCRPSFLVWGGSFFGGRLSLSGMRGCAS